MMRKLCFICLSLCICLIGYNSIESSSDVTITKTEQNVLQDDISENTIEQTMLQGDVLPDSTKQTTAQEDELFNWDGVNIQLLAEDEKVLSETDRKEFLAVFGFKDSEPFYVHTDEDGYPFMELYYDEEREIGCGIRYGEYSTCGFAFNNFREVSWYPQDPFSVLSIRGETAENYVYDYQENYECDEEGKLLSFQSTGEPVGICKEEWDNYPIIKVDFTYDDMGRLRERKYHHASIVFGTTCSSQTSYYDESGRLSHTSSYITHGSLEGYYIYESNNDVPSYYLSLDHMGSDSWPTFYKFVKRDDNWKFGGFRRSDKEVNPKIYEIEPGGEMDFLAEQGFTEADLFYEYTWSSGIIEFRLSLYCDEDLTRGLGFIRDYKDGEYIDLEIFTFDGCDEYLHTVSPFSVYSSYNLMGKSTHFLEGENIDDYFRSLELDQIHSVNFDYDEDGKLIHMHQGLTHGDADRFYIYSNGRCYNMLEVDHGWGVTFYKF